MTHRRRFFIALAVGLAVWLGVCFGGVWPWFARVEAERIALRDLRREAALISEKLRAGATLAGVGAQLEADHRRLTETFLNEENTLDFIREVEELAGTHRLQHELAVAATPRRKGSGDAFAFNLDLTGSFPDVVRFLAALEQAAWWLTVDGVRFDKTATSAIRATATLRVFTPYLSESNGAGFTPSP